MVANVLPGRALQSSGGAWSSQASLSAVSSLSALLQFAVQILPFFCVPPGVKKEKYWQALLFGGNSGPQRGRVQGYGWFTLLPICDLPACFAESTLYVLVAVNGHIYVTGWSERSLSPSYSPSPLWDNPAGPDIWELKKKLHSCIQPVIIDHTVLHSRDTKVDHRIPPPVNLTERWMCTGIITIGHAEGKPRTILACVRGHLSSPWSPPKNGRWTQCGNKTFNLVWAPELTVPVVQPLLMESQVH